MSEKSQELTNIEVETVDVIPEPLVSWNKGTEIYFIYSNYKIDYQGLKLLIINHITVIYVTFTILASLSDITSSPMKNSLTRHLEKQRFLQPICFVQNSSNSEVLISLLQIADSKRFNLNIECMIPIYEF